MFPDSYLLSTSLLALAGFLFSGYMSVVRLIKKKCAFNDTCPFIIGVPACWYGFVLFAILLGTDALALAGWISEAAAATVLLWTSSLGVLLSGCLTVPEMFRWFVSRTRYGLVLPSCAYGLVFYAAIFLLSI